MTETEKLLALFDTEDDEVIRERFRAKLLEHVEARVAASYVLGRADQSDREAALEAKLEEACEVGCGECDKCEARNAEATARATARAMEDT